MEILNQLSFYVSFCVQVLVACHRQKENHSKIFSGTDGCLTYKICFQYINWKKKFLSLTEFSFCSFFLLSTCLSTTCLSAAVFRDSFKGSTDLVMLFWFQHSKLLGKTTLHSLRPDIKKYRQWDSSFLVALPVKLCQTSSISEHNI